MKNDTDSNGGNGRGGNGQFAKGNPGGPGNPNVRFLAEYRRKFAEAADVEVVAEAVQVLRKIMNNAKAKGADRIAAARELLDRCIGKPTAILTGPDGGPIQFENKIVIDAARDPESFDLIDRLSQRMVLKPGGAGKSDN